MKTQMSLPIVLVLVASSAALLFSSCGDSKADSANVPPVPLTTVSVDEIRSERLTDILRVVGTVKAYEDVTVSPEEGGVVKAWKFPKGGVMRKGEPMVLLKDEVARATYEAASAAHKTTQLNLDKQKSVYKEQGISELAYRTFQYQRDAAKANADLARARLERTVVRSPIDGILEETYIDMGEFAPPGMPIARVVNNERVKILAEVPELFAGTVRVGTAAMVTVDAYPGDTLRGIVSFVGSTVSPANRSMAVEVHLTNPGRRLKPEMVAKVSIERSVRENVLLVKEDVLQLVDRDRHIVYVVVDGRAVERRVRAGARQGNRVEIIEGLNVGDAVVTAGHHKLVNDTPVAVVD